MTENRKSIKVAILLYGQARFINNDIPFLSHKLHLLSQYDCDFFCHVWFDKKQSFYNTSSWSTLPPVPVDPLTVAKIQKLYQPKQLIVEPDIQFWPVTNNKAKEDDNKQTFIRDVPVVNLSAEHVHLLTHQMKNQRDVQTVFSHFYSLQQATKAFEQYCNKTNTNYHFIVKSRFDLNIVDFPDLTTLTTNAFYLCNHHKNFPDIVFVAGSKFSPCLHVFDHIDSLLDRALQFDSKVLIPEALLRARFEQCNQLLYKQNEWDILHPISDLRGFFTRKSHRTAVVISGQYRSFDKVINNILQKFIVPNQADVFVVLSENTLPQPHSAINELFLMGKLKRCFCVTSEMVADSIEMKDVRMRMRAMQPLLNKDVLKQEAVDLEKYYSSNAIQFLLLKKAAELISEHESNINQKYDFIIKVRTDMMYETVFDIRDIFFESPFISKKKFDLFVLNLIQDFNVEVADIDYTTFQNMLYFVFGSRLEDLTRYVSMFANETIHFNNERKTTLPDSERLDYTGRIKTFLKAHFSSQLFGGAYFQNVRFLKYLHTSGFFLQEKEKQEFFYLINDHVLACRRDLFTYLSHFIDHIGDAGDHDHTAFFWTPEYQLMQYLDKRALSVMLVHGVKVVN